MTTNQPDNAGVIAPPGVIALVAIALGLALDWLWPTGLLQDALAFSVRLTLGGLLMAAGLGIAIAAGRIFHSIGTDPLPWKPATRLAATGIYAHTRNPMYIGLALLIAGLGIALASKGILIMLIPSVLVLHYGVVKREERYLEGKFGEDYRRFKATVPRYGWRV